MWNSFSGLKNSYTHYNQQQTKLWPLTQQRWIFQLGFYIHIISYTINRFFYFLCSFTDDFINQGTGMILLYTLKNPSYPKYHLPTDCGVMCLDIHPVHCYLICAGFYDGSVAVYNLCNIKNPLIQRCTAKNGKHTDPVWEVSYYC